MASSLSMYLENCPDNEKFAIHLAERIKRSTMVW